MLLKRWFNMRLAIVLILLATLAAGAGCRRRDRQSETEAGLVSADTATLEAVEPTAPDIDFQILQFISTEEKGTTLELEACKWGEIITVTVGEAYFSALGEVGRRATITDVLNSMIFDISIIEINNEWQFAPDVLSPVKNG